MRGVGIRPISKSKKNKITSETKEYANVWNRNFTGFKRKLKEFLNARVSPTEQFNKHSLNNSHVPSIEPGAGVKETNKIISTIAFLQTSLSPEGK